MNDKFHEECGVVGVYGHPEAANLVYLGLYALQHRGQESAGIATADGERLRLTRAIGAGFGGVRRAILEFDDRRRRCWTCPVLDGGR